LQKVVIAKIRTPLWVTDDKNITIIIYISSEFIITVYINITTPVEILKINFNRGYTEHINRQNAMPSG